MTAKVISLKSLPVLLNEYHKQFTIAQESEGRAHSARIRAGQLLLEMRARVEAGEAGNVSWWEWYRDNSVRSRKDAEKVMALARADDPEAAHEEAKAANRQEQARHRSKAAADVSGDQDESFSSDTTDADEYMQREARPTSATIKLIMGLIRNLDPDQREDLFAKLRKRYKL